MTMGDKDSAKDKNSEADKEEKSREEKESRRRRREGVKEERRVAVAEETREKISVIGASLPGNVPGDEVKQGFYIWWSVCQH